MNVKYFIHVYVNLVRKELSSHLGLLPWTHSCLLECRKATTLRKLTEDVEKCRLELNKRATEFDPVTSSPTGFGTPYGYSPAAAAAPAYGTCFLFVFPAYNFLLSSPNHTVHP